MGTYVNFEHAFPFSANKQSNIFITTGPTNISHIKDTSDARGQNSNKSNFSFLYILFDNSFKTKCHIYKRNEIGTLKDSLPSTGGPYVKWFSLKKGN